MRKQMRTHAKDIVKDKSNIGGEIVYALYK